MGFFTGLEHEKKESRIREVERLKKLEDAKQNLRWRAADMVKNGFSYRKATEILNRSHWFVRDLDRSIAR